MSRSLRSAGRSPAPALAAAALLTAAALGLAALDPVGFQKVAALTAAPARPFEPASEIDVAPLVRSIPDRGEAGAAVTVYDVLPERKHRRTVVEGFGNCSNLVFGMAFALRQRGADYEIVHFLPRETFLDGDGHTVIRTRFPLDAGAAVGLVDVVGRALPMSGGQPLDVAGLGRGEIADLAFHPLGAHDPRWERFYAADFQRGVLVGRIEARSVDRYYRFLEASYVDLGLPPQLEKLIWDGAAVVLGFYPQVHVESVAEARRGHALRFFALEASLWVLRLVPLAALLVLAASLARRFTRA
jgi:hypothetical protein